MWNHAVFSKNRDRLLSSDVAQQFFAEVNRQARRFMSDEQFTVDGTLIQAWASQQSFRSKDGSDDGDGTDFHGQSRSNKTHESTTDADTRLCKKSYGKESKLSYLGHALVENRNGLIADGDARRRLCRARCSAVDAQAKATGAFAPHHRGCGQGLGHEGFRAHGAGVGPDTTCYEERQGTPQQPGRQNHTPARLCRQPEPQVAEGKELRS